MSLAFLALGLLGILLTIDYLPRMAADLARKQEELKRAGLQKELETIVTQLGESELKRQSALLTDIDTTFKSMSASVAGISSVKTGFLQAESDLKATQKDIQDLQAKVSGGVAKLEAATKWFDSKPGDAAKPDASASALTSKLLLTIEQTLKDKTTSQDALSTTLAALRNHLAEHRQVMGAMRACRYYNRSWIDMREASAGDQEVLTAYLQRNMASAVGVDPPERPLAASTYEAITSAIDAAMKGIPASGLMLIEDTASRDALLDVASNYRSTSAAATELKDMLASVKTRLDAAEKSLAALIGNPSYVQLMDDKAGVLARVSAAAGVIDSNLKTSEQSSKLVASARSAVSSLEDVIQMQRNIAFGAASPAFILMLAICGMFTVFGATSLMRWLKTVEQHRMEAAWRERTKTYLAIVTGLASVGIDSVEVLRELQRIRFSEERERPVPATPVLASLSEIVAAGRK